MTKATRMTKTTKTRGLACTVTFALMLGVPCAAQAPAPESAVLAQLDAFLGRVYPSEGRAGAVVLAQRHGEVIFRKAFGLADVELGVAMTPEHRLAMGSMTKPFTALALLRMAEEGSLALDDPVAGYIPEVAHSAPRVTVAHLLSHAGGIRNYNEIPSFQARIREDFTPEELLAVFAQEPPDFPPGTEWHYSNSGYHLLGLIAERVSGRSFAEVLRDYALEPIGARDAVLASDAAIITGRVSGYEITKGKLRNAQPMSLSIPWAGGGLFGTVDDLAALDRAMASGILGDADLQRKQLVPVTLADGRPGQSSLGWFVGRLGERPMQYHGGGIYGFVGHMLRIPDEGLFVAVLSNLVDRGTSYPTRGVAEQAARILLGEVDTAPPRQAVDLPREKLVRCTGTYAVAPGQLRVIQLAGDGLQFGAPGGRMIDILPESSSVFFVPGARGYLEFELDGRGDAIALLIHTADGQVLRAPKQDGTGRDPGDVPVG